MAIHTMMPMRSWAIAHCSMSARLRSLFRRVSPITLLPVPGQRGADGRDSAPSSTHIRESLWRRGVCIPERTEREPPADHADANEPRHGLHLSARSVQRPPAAEGSLEDGERRCDG